MYTEKILKKLNKTKLVEIAADNGIEVSEGVKNDGIITLILQKGCPIREDDADAEVEDNEADAAPRFSKEQLLKSSRYSHKRDILAVLLEDDKTYSHVAVNKLIKNFSERKIK